VQEFCIWSGARPNHDKSEITAYDFATRTRLNTQSILLGGKQLVDLDPQEPFRYLGFRFSLTGKWKAEIDHIFDNARLIHRACKGHPYTPGQAVRAVQMVQESQFRYSAPLARWTDANLRSLHGKWVANVKAALTLPQASAIAPWVLPEHWGGKTLRQPEVVLLQTLTGHIVQTVSFDDDLLAMAQHNWRLLCLELGKNHFERRSHSMGSLRVGLPATFGYLNFYCQRPGFLAGLPTLGVGPWGFEPRTSHFKSAVLVP